MLTWQVTYAPRAPTAPLVAAGLRGGGDVPAPPIGQPSDRSIGAQSRLQIRERCWRRRRSQRRRQQLPLLSNAPRSDAGVLGPPWTTKVPPGARRPVRWHPLRAAPAGAPTTAVAPPLMEGRSARPRGAAGARRSLASPRLRVAAGLRAGLAGPRRGAILFSTSKILAIEETQAGRLEALRDGRCSPSARPDFRIAR